MSIIDATLRFNAQTHVWTLTDAGFIKERRADGVYNTAPASYPSPAYEVTAEQVPFDPVRETGGSFWRLLSGPDAGKLVSAWTNRLGYGDITVVHLPDGYIPPSDSSFPRIDPLADWRILIKGLGTATALRTPTTVVVNATTNRYSLRSDGMILLTDPRATIPAGGPYRVTPVVVPRDPVRNTGGSFLRMEDGPFAGWLLSNWTNRLGYGNITITTTAIPERGPGPVIATLYRPNAHSAGFSINYNAAGELHFTLLVDDPNIRVVIPKRTHATVEFKNATTGAWDEVWAGMIWDQDATDTETVFYGVDYLGLLQYCVDERFNPARPKQPPPVGSYYVNQTIKAIIDSQLDHAISRPHSIVGFIKRGPTDAMDARVEIPSTLTQTLPFVVGLINSHRAGTGKNTRLFVRKTTAGVYEFVIQNNPGINRDGMLIRYGGLAQGYRVIQFGQEWASRVNVVGRTLEGLKVLFQSEDAGVDQGEWGRIAQEPVVIETFDRHDLRRRALQLALDSSRLGRQISVGLKLGSFRPREGYEICDHVPIEINHGSVVTKDWASDIFGAETPGDASEINANYWTIRGLEWQSFSDGHWMTNLVLFPKGGGRAVMPTLCGGPYLPGGHFPPLGIGLEHPNRYTGGVFGITIYSHADGVIAYWTPGILEPATVTPFYAGSLRFSNITVADSNFPSGTCDRISMGLGSKLFFFIACGGGKAVIHWGPEPSNPGPQNPVVAITVEHYDPAGMGAWIEHRYFHETISGYMTTELTMPEDGFAHRITVDATAGVWYPPGGNLNYDIRFGGLTWTPNEEMSVPITEPPPSSVGWGPPPADTTSNTYTDLNTGVVYVRNDATGAYEPVPGTGSVVDFTFGLSTQWVINHTMNGFPRVTLRDQNGVVIEAMITYTSASTITINFSSPVAGSARLG